TYALLEERAAAAKTLKRDEALAELTRRYFRSHTPATLQDFVWWSGLTVEDAKRGMAEVGTRGSAQTKQSPPNSAHLLPAFDEYFVAYKDRQIAAGTWKRTNSGTIQLNPSRALKDSEKLTLKEAADRYADYLGDISRRR